MKSVLADIILRPYPGTWVDDAIHYAVALVVLTGNRVQLEFNDHQAWVDRSSTRASITRDLGLHQAIPGKGENHDD